MNDRLNELDEAKPVRVLIVEDNRDDQMLLQRQLKKAGISNVLFLSDPKLALEWLQGPSGGTLRRELIALFLDVDLPYMTGIDLLRLVRLLEGMEEIPVMVMTASARPETIEACHELKVRAFVEKPVTYHDFSKVIAPLFHQSLKTPASLLETNKPREIESARVDKSPFIRNLPTMVFRCL
jgi:CheY-like chemotaxis protein